VYLFPHGVSRSPIVSRAGAIFVDVEVFRVVYILVGAILYCIEYLYMALVQSPSLMLIFDLGGDIPAVRGRVV
jgi:hypothetical protein